MQKLALFSKLFVCLSMFFTLFACKPNEEEIISTNSGTATIQGQVINVNGESMAGVKVSSGNISTLTDIDGHYTLKNLAASNKTLVNFYIQNCSETQKIIKTENNKTSYVNAALQNYQIISEINPSFATISNANFSVEFPENAFVDSKGKLFTGKVTVYASHFSTDDINFANAFPGEFYGRRTDNSISSIESFGFIDVVLKNGNEKINLAPGKKAKVKINISEMHKKRAAPTIPLWYYDTQKGEWIEEGFASLNSSNQYVAELSHFTAWNIDQVQTVSYISGIIQDFNNQALEFTQVFATGVDYIGTSVSFSDKNGYFKIAVKANSIVSIQGQFGNISTETKKVKSDLENMTKDIGIIKLFYQDTLSGWNNFIHHSESKFFGFHFISEKEGWAVSKEGIFHTSNSGQTWTMRSTANDAFGIYDPNISNLTQILFLDANIGFVLYSSSNSTKLLKTSDGGLSWQSILANVSHIRDIKSIGARVIVQAKAKILISDDSGNTWIEKISPDQMISSEIKVIDKSQYYYASSKELIYTSDAGNTWKKIPINNLKMQFVTPFQMFNASEFVYLDNQGKILRTKDGGATFAVTKELSYYSSEMKFYFRNSKEGWLYKTYLYSQNSPILYTNDSGKTWTEVTNWTSNFINYIYFLDDKTGWMYDPNGIIKFTKNGAF